MRGTTKRSYGKLLIVVTTTLIVVATSQECDKMKCKGPLRFYEDLKCKPVYDKPNDCCAVRYNCSHLSGRSADKCYMDGREYTIGEQLKDEVANPCDFVCICVKGQKDLGLFACASVDCISPPPLEKGCYFKRQADSCCTPAQVCPKDGEKIFECIVEGKTYKIGETFYPSGYPEKKCLCKEGYKGENVKPFCREVSCGTEMVHAVELRENCAPVFHSDQSPRTSCSYSYRCQNINDTIVQAENQNISGKGINVKEVSDDMKCKFGNMTLNIGEELNRATDYSFTGKAVCVECVCEVPPAPTCQRLPDDQCNVTFISDFMQ